MIKYNNNDRNLSWRWKYLCAKTINTRRPTNHRQCTAACTLSERFQCFRFHYGAARGFKSSRGILNSDKVFVYLLRLNWVNYNVIATINRSSRCVVSLMPTIYYFYFTIIKWRWWRGRRRRWRRISLLDGRDPIAVIGILSSYLWL